jgi:cobalt-zinc-cadmium efflux system outer membrane protein
VVWSALLLPGSCTHIDATPERQQAEQAMQQATGLHPRWSPPPELRELRAGDDNTVTLEQAIELALVNNRALRADLETISQAKADLVQAGLLSNPVLSAMLRFPEGGGRAMLEFALAKDFADLWLIPSRKRAAQAMVQERVLAFADTAITLVNEVRTQYHTLQYQSEAIALQEQNRGILQQAFDVAEARFRAGDTSLLDVNLTRGSLLEIDLQLIQLRNDYRTTRLMLLRLMGVARAHDNWKPEPLSSEFAPLAFSEEDLIDAALERRLDIQAASWELESAVAEFQQQQLRVIPTLTVGVSGERGERRAQPGRRILGDTARASVAAGQLTAPEIESVSQRRLERSLEIDFILGPAIDVPLPIFDQNQAQIAKARARAKQLQQTYEERQQRVVEGIRTALTARRRAEQQTRFYRESLLPLQEENTQFARRLYQAGEQSIITVLLAQQALIQTRLNYNASLRDLSISAANLERQLARRLSDIPTTLPATQPSTQP